MENLSREQVRRFRMHTHHLDSWHPPDRLLEIAGACGLQNSPPGAWENAVFNRIEGAGPDTVRQALEVDKTLLQAWSLRGAPVVFPTRESGAFLSALVPTGDEPWLYTRGIQLALDFLGMPFSTLLALLVQVMPQLDGEVLHSKTTLDQTLAEWVLPLLPVEKRALWNSPSMYGSPDKQTVGGAVVSFLLRPCALMGLVVFGRRQGSSPTFTSYKGWAGHPLAAGDTPERALVRKYLHCYGPATVGGLTAWLGCSPQQASRLWQSAAEEMQPVAMEGKRRYILTEDRPLLQDPPRPERPLHLLSGHDPYLGLQDRETILEDKARQKQIWQTVSNPGAVLADGAVAGMWKSRKKGQSLAIEVSLWGGAEPSRRELEALAHANAAKQGLKISSFTVSP